MNLVVPGMGMRFVIFRYDGLHMSILGHAIERSGHLSVSPSGRWLLTDAYPWEDVSPGDGTVPLRIIDIASETEHVVARVSASPVFMGPSRELRCDPHPAWESGGSRFAFNACSRARRHVYVAEFGPDELDLSRQQPRWQPRFAGEISTGGHAARARWT